MKVCKSIVIATFFLSTFLPAIAQQKSTMHAYVENLLSKMTLEEKIGQLNLVTPGGAVTGEVVSSDVDNKIRNGQVGGLFGITGPANIRRAQEIAVKNSRLHIPLIFGLDVIHGHRTIFPIPLGLSSSWDTLLIEKSAQLAAREATADGLAWVYSPMVDIARDPRWGRIAEGSGEDAYLGSAIARAMVKGYQGTNMAADTTVMACVKHYALYGAAEGGRDYNTTDMSRIKMFEYYMPPYKAAVDAGVGSVMTSFNEIDGIPATGNKWLINELLRKDWGFNGLVVTDYTSINEMTAHGLGDLQTVSALALSAGVDMDMVGEGFLSTLPKSLKEKKINQKEIDNACRRVLEAKYKLGLFDDPYRYCNEARAEKELLSVDNRMHAREIAAHSLVLLKNTNSVLPLKKSATIALVGPLADNKRNMLGTWSVSGDPEQSVTVMQGIKNVAGKDVEIIYAKGANISNDTTFAKNVNAFGEEIQIDKRSATALINEAVEAANKADVVVAVMGEAADMTGEASSMSNIELQPAQRDLLKALVETKKPIVLVLMNGRPMALQWEDDNVQSILDVWFAGTEAGNAIADVLFGNYNPSGKLTATFPRNTGQIPIYYNYKNTGRPLEGEGFQKFRSAYLDVPNSPLYPFGYGLSYTTFNYSNVQVSNENPKGNETLKATITVTNAGMMAGEETVQIYISDPVASIARPVKELKGFSKVFLQPGESKEVTFYISPDHLKFFHSDLSYDWEPGEFIISVGTNSRDVKTQKVTWNK